MIEPDANAAALRQLNRRILLPLTIGLCLSFWCRVNISFGALQMDEALGMTPAGFGLSVSLLFGAYALFEVPSCYGLVRVGARRWLFAMLLVWGLGTIASAFVPNMESLYVVRFLIGVAEAGYPATCAYCIARWYPVSERSKALSRWMSVGLVAMALSGPASTLVMSVPVVGLANWQWLFVMGGLPTLVLAMFFLRKFCDRPGDASWLSADSRAALYEKPPGERTAQADRSLHHSNFGHAFRAPTTWIYMSAIFLITTGGSILVVWFPQIIRATRPDLSIQEIGMFGSIPVLISAPVNLIVTQSCRRIGDTRWHIAGFLLAAAACLVIGLQSKSDIMLGFAVVVGVCAFVSCQIILFSLPTTVLAGAAVAGAVALINSCNSLGFTAGPYVMGLLRERTHSFESGLYLSASAFVLAALLPLTLGRFFPSLTPKVSGGRLQGAPVTR